VFVFFKVLKRASPFSQKKNEPKRKVVAALFSIKTSAQANVVLPENQEAT
jgi:hypothetical protein